MTASAEIGYTPRTFSAVDEVIARVGERIAHIPVEDARGNMWTACGEFAHDMPRRLLMDALDADWRCPACFPDPKTRYPRFVCSRCGDLVSTRPEKAENRIHRPDGGWDHAAVCGTSAISPGRATA